jgi:hypothetical protein
MNNNIMQIKHFANQEIWEILVNQFILWDSAKPHTGKKGDII